MAESLLYLDQGYVATANASGVATITIGPTGIQQWLVHQINIELVTASPSGTVCKWRKSGGAAGAVVPDTDSIGGDPPVMLRPGEVITIQWTGLTVGQVAKAMAFYDIVPWGS